MADTLRELSKGALNDLEGVFAKLPDEAADPLIEAIVAAKLRQADRRVRLRPRGPADARLRDAAVPHGAGRFGLGRHDDASRRPRRSAVRLRRTGPTSDRASSRRHRPRG